MSPQRLLLFVLVALPPLFAPMTTRGATPSEIKSFLDDEANGVTDDGLLPETAQAVAAARYIVQNWRQMLTDIEQVAPDARRQNLIVVGAEFLPPREYVEFVTAVCALKESSRVTLSPIKTIAAARMFKDGFLAFNYDKPEVTPVLTKLETLLKNDDSRNWTDYFAAIRSGQAKQTIVTERTRDGDLLPESINDGPSDAYRKLVGP